MNKTQKSALCNTIMFTLLLLFSLLLFVEMVITGKIYQQFHLIFAGLILALMIFSLLFIFKKQSKKEPDSDERDGLIMKRAVLVSFISVWVLLYVSSIAPTFIVGEQGAVPVDMFPIINFVIFLIAMLVYNIAVLIQYGRATKDE